MKTKTLIAAAVLAFAGAAQAEMVDISTTQSEKTTLRAMVGSVVANKSGATGIFGMTHRDYKGGPSTSNENFRVTVSTKTCKNGFGNAIMTTLSGERLDVYEWVDGDRTLYDLMVGILCEAVKDVKGVRL